MGNNEEEKTRQNNSKWEKEKKKEEVDIFKSFLAFFLKTSLCSRPRVVQGKKFNENQCKNSAKLL